MSDIESRPGHDARSANWGFLEDMASTGRLDMVLGDVERPAPVPEETQPEENLDQE